MLACSPVARLAGEFGVLLCGLFCVAYWCVLVVILVVVWGVLQLLWLSIGDLSSGFGGYASLVWWLCGIGWWLCGSCGWPGMFGVWAFWFVSVVVVGSLIVVWAVCFALRGLFW